MCHEVTPKTGVCYVPMNGSIVGLKTMECSYVIRKEKTIWRAWLCKHYYAVDKNGMFHARPKKQEVLFQVPLEAAGTITKSLDIIAGMHLHPFSSEAKSGRLENTAIWIRHTRSLVSMTFNVAPVLFSIEDVLFFDGKNVSVKSFRLPGREEAYDLGKRIYGTEALIEVPFDEANTLPKDCLLEQLWSRHGFPFFHDGKFYL